MATGLSEVCKGCRWTEIKGKERVKDSEKVHKNKLPWPHERQDKGDWPNWPEYVPLGPDALCASSGVSSAGTVEMGVPQMPSSSSQDPIHPIQASLLTAGNGAPEARPPSPEPWVTLLFSGGVFQWGVSSRHAERACAGRY